MATSFHGRWFSSGTPASSTTKTGGHDIAEILLKVALNTKKSNQINQARKVSGHVDTCMCVSGIEFVLFVLFSIGFWNWFNATFSNISAISWPPVLVVEEAGVPEENHRPWASNW
jgi:hypothetical protein